MMTILSALTLSLLTWPAWVAGGPLIPRQSTNTPINQTTLNTLQLYEQYATVSYCGANFNGQIGAKVTCPGGTCPLVEQKNVTIVDRLGNGVRDTGYVIALDIDRQLVVVSFRGSRSTANIVNVLTAAIFPQVNLDLCNGCMGASAFSVPYQSVRTNILTKVRTALEQNPGFQVVTTGHSLGGALSHLAGLDFRNQGWTVDLASYGSPRVGNQALATNISNSDNQPRPNGGSSYGRNFRVVHVNDPVPFLPFKTSRLTTAKYAHAEPFFNIGTNYVVFGIGAFETLTPERLPPVPNVALGDVTLMNTTDIDITNAMLGTLLGRGGPQLYGDHSFYFTKISQCLELATVPPGVASRDNSTGITGDQFVNALKDYFNKELNGNGTPA